MPLFKGCEDFPKPKSIEDTLTASGYVRPEKGGRWRSGEVKENPLVATRIPPTGSEAMAESLKKGLKRL